MFFTWNLYYWIFKGCSMYPSLLNTYYIIITLIIIDYYDIVLGV